MSFYEEEEYYDSEYDSDSEYSQEEEEPEYSKKEEGSSNASFTPVTVAISAPNPPVKKKNDEEEFEAFIKAMKENVKEGTEKAKDYIDRVYELELTDDILRKLFELSVYQDLKKDMIDLLQHLMKVTEEPVKKQNLKSILAILNSLMECD